MSELTPLIALRHRLLEVTATAVVGLVAAIGGDQALATESMRHPLDPLTVQEYEAVIHVLEEENYGDFIGLYPLITLDEPAKADVLQWKPGDALPRRAFVIVMDGPRTYEAIVDITGGQMVSWKEIKGVQPSVLLSQEWTAVQIIVRGNRDWQAAVRKRGIQNFRDVVCIPHTVGNYGLPEEEGRRLLKVTCYDSSGVKNFWGRPIEGLIVVVDLLRRKIVRMIDTGIVPTPKGPVDFDPDSVGKLREPLNPISVVQPTGPTYQVRGHVVSWQKWQFHFRIDPRLGPVISTVRYNDRGKMRSILYQGSLSELFVPYMDPGEGWYFRTYMDIGEYGVGKLAVTLQPGLDCPANAMFFDAVFADDWGLDYARKRATCLFERYAGDIAWRHYEAVNGETEVRRRTDLVLRFISAIGNYDYVFDWVFRQDAAMEIAVGATGTEQVKAVRSRVTAGDKDDRDDAHGHMAAEHTVAINHDHFFAFRLDLDVDGQQNSFVTERLVPERPAPGNPRRSIWRVEARIAATEQDAKLRISIEKPALWRVINPNVLGPLGYPVSYQLKAKTNAVSLLSSDDFAQRRAGFTDFHLWVTPFDRQERFAAGAYPNQSKGGDGLPRWTSANRSVRNTDLVLWYTLGVHHVVRAEDWPILSTAWSRFELRPFDFFQRNPALDLPD